MHHWRRGDRLADRVAGAALWFVRRQFGWMVPAPKDVVDVAVVADTLATRCCIATSQTRKKDGVPGSSDKKQ
jgi:hypothetical protein